MLAEFIYFCWRCFSNALKQDNQAAILLGSSLWIPYFLLALPAMNISTMEWRSFLGVCWVFPVNSNRTTKQRFTKVLQHKSLILDLKRIMFAVFMMFWFSLLTLTEFYFLFFSGSTCLFPMNSNRLTDQRFFHASSTWTLHYKLVHPENIFVFGLKQRL